MATTAAKAANIRLGAESIKLIEQFLRVGVLEYHKKNCPEFHNKLERIDVAYARYKAAQQTAGTDGTDVRSNDANESVGIDDIQIPVVISQVDSFVGYLADVYLSGYPMFPVVSDPADMREAELLEAIIDTHSTLAGYPRHFLMSFRDGIKYNFMPIEHAWEPIEQYNLVSDYLKPTEASQLKQVSQNLTKIRRLDPYNFVWDRRVSPANLCYEGEFAGYIDIVNRVNLKRFMNTYSQSGELYNLGDINQMTTGAVTGNYYFTQLPTITDMMSPSKGKQGEDFDWNAWLGLDKSSPRKLKAGSYERFVCYARIIPSDFKMYNVPTPNSPQIWKFILINGTKLLYAKRIYTIYDALPILIGQPLEDGFDLQTQSIAESQIPMQDAATTLFNIRFNSARRAVSDRALFDPTLINESDVNARQPAAKIPVRLSGLNDKDFTRAYQAIPFDHRGTDSVIVDARTVLDLSDKLSGLNQPQQGRFQKGNKSVQEWTDTMNNADNRPRLPALMTEFQVMMPIKQQIKLNIFQHGVTGTFQSFKTGSVYNIKSEEIEKLKQKVLSFRIADGYTPKSKIASTEFLGRLLDTLSQSQILQQLLGGAMPGMFAHLAQLGGVRGLDQYLPKAQSQSPQGAPANGQPNQPPPATT